MSELCLASLRMSTNSACRRCLGTEGVLALWLDVGIGCIFPAISLRAGSRAVGELSSEVSSMNSPGSVNGVP